MSNRKYQEFVEDGGYAEDRWWTEAAGIDRKKFVDGTGKLGPLFWKDGRCPEGKGGHSVVGISFAKQVAKADAAAASNQLPALKNEITRFDDLLKQKSAIIAEEEKIVVHNHEDACRIYKSRYEARDQALRDLKRRTRPEGEPAPK